MIDASIPHVVHRLPAMPERELENHVRTMARQLHLLLYHTWDSRRSAFGFPDLVIVGPRGVLWRELKTDKGRLTAAQQQWGEALLKAGQDWAVWRPADLRAGRVAHELAKLRARGPAA